MVDAAYLFGSQALSEAGADSDFDIGVYLNRRLNGSERFKLRLDLIGKLGVELKTDKIDLAVINDLNSVFLNI